MRSEASLDELVSLWQAEKARGRDLPAAELCADCPERAEELARRIEAVRRMSALARGGDATCIPGATAAPVPPAALVSIAPLMQGLRQHRLLDAALLHELETEASRFADAKALAADLIRRGWLTAYQGSQLLHGRGRDLRLGSYVLLERLGEGGMGAVFKARHGKLGRVVALKLIRQDRLANPDAIRRFRREVQAAAALSHPNIVHAYDADEIGGTHLLIMECVEGAADLADLLEKRGPLPVAQACEYVRQAALGLQHACERGLVHRDIKPSNLLVTADGRTVKILDMGLARLDHAATDGQKSSTMTQEGAIMGTPDYIAPEQAMDAHDVDIRADLYSLGCTFYHLLTGRVPFPGTLMQKLVGHRYQDAAPVESLRPDVPPAVAAVVRKLMAKKPEDRYQTPAEVAAALGRPQGRTAPAAVTAGAAEETVVSPFADLDGGATPVVVVPQGSPGVGWRWLLPAAAAGSLVLAGLVILLVGLLHKGTEQPPRHIARDTGDNGTHSARAPRKVDDAWLKEVAALPAERQVAIVVAKLKELNPGFDGKETHKIEGGGVTELSFLTDSVTDISPVQALTSLGRLECHGGVDGGDGKGKLVDLSPLKGMPLRELNCHGNPVSSLSPLKGMQLTSLECGNSRIADLSPLQGMPLTKLWCHVAPVKDLSPIQGMKLASLNCSFTPVSDLAPLTGMPLTALDCQYTQVADLSPLKDMPLTFLMCAYTPVSKLSPLKGMKLTQLRVAATKVSDLSPLKGMPLAYLSCSLTRVADLSPLTGMSLTVLECNNTPVLDLSPLTGMPLTTLDCGGTQVKDLSPLKGLKLTSLYCGGTQVSDLSPLRGMPLTLLSCDFKPDRDSSILRSIPTLETINGKPARKFLKDATGR